MLVPQAKRPRAMHFCDGYSGETVCGKSAPHTRHTFTLWIWDNKLLADGRRCPECAEFVSVNRERLENER